MSRTKDAERTPEAREAQPALDVETPVGPGSPEFERTLDERARELARPAARIDSDITSATHIRFEAGGVTFSVDSDAVVRVLHDSKVARIPGAPRQLDRVLHVDGRITSLIDPVTFVDAGIEPVSRRSVLLLESGARRIGLFADVVHGLDRVSGTELAEMRDAASASTTNFVVGTSATMVVVLDSKSIVSNAGAGFGVSAERRR
jgi:chemotaxis signal transduction protein